MSSLCLDARLYVGLDVAGAFKESVVHLGSGDDKEPPGFDRVGGEVADVLCGHDPMSGSNRSHIDVAVRGDAFEDVRDDPGWAQACDANASDIPTIACLDAT